MQEALPRRADNTAGEFSRRRVGDGDVNLADVYQRSRGWVHNPKQEEVWRVRVDRLLVRVLGVHDDGGCHGGHDLLWPVLLRPSPT